MNKAKNKIKCPKCGSASVIIKRRDVGAGSESGMPSRPPKKPLRCADCNHEFGYAEGG